MAEIRETLTLEDKFTGQLTRYIKLGQQAAGVSDDMRASLLNIETATAATATAVDRLTNQILEMNTTSRQATAGADALLGKLKSLLATYAGMQSIKMLGGLSDTMAQTTARLDMMNDGLQTTAELNQMIYESAQRSRGSYQATADMVAKLGTLAGDAFSSSQELVAFSEQLNKQIALSGAPTQAADAAMLQLTQAMASGVLRGDELNSILEQTPTIAQAIAEYMGVSTGVMREMASQGAITADVVKNAMFAAADETNAKFEQMPMTWEQVWTSFKNTATTAMQPILTGINVLANNMETVAPIAAGVAAALGTYAAATAASAAVTWLQVAANRALVASMLTNPIMWVAVGIGIVIGLIYKWVQATGGIQVAWLIAKDNILTAVEELQYGFTSFVYGVEDGFATMATNVVGFIQNMVNGAINAINFLIEQVIKTHIVSIPTISPADFADDFAVQRQAEVAARAASLNSLRFELNRNQAVRDLEIRNAQAASTVQDSGTPPYTEPPAYNQMAELTEAAKGIEKSVNMSNEDLKMLIDNAERRYVNNVNLTAQTPVINITGANTGNTAADRKALADAIQTVLVEQVASTSVRATAVPT